MTAAEQVEKIFRQEHGRVLAALISQFEDFDLAEDSLQDALVNALERWVLDGVPRNPGAWLLTIARRRAIDRLRRAATLERKGAILDALATQDEPEMDDSIPDERLKLMFTCCHPSVCASNWGTRAGSWSEASCTNQIPSLKAPLTVWATCTASRVLPQPPVPVKVRRRLSPNKRVISTISRSRPMNRVNGRGRFWGAMLTCSTKKCTFSGAGTRILVLPDHSSSSVAISTSTLIPQRSALVLTPFCSAA
jgi:hypothetical protein